MSFPEILFAKQFLKIKVPFAGFVSPFSNSFKASFKLESISPFVISNINRLAFSLSIFETISSARFFLKSPLIPNKFKINGVSK